MCMLSEVGRSCTLEFEKTNSKILVELHTKPASRRDIAHAEPPHAFAYCSIHHRISCHICRARWENKQPQGVLPLYKGIHHSNTPVRMPPCRLPCLLCFLRVGPVGKRPAQHLLHIGTELNMSLPTPRTSDSTCAGTSSSTATQVKGPAALPPHMCRDQQPYRQPYLDHNR